MEDENKDLLEHFIRLMEKKLKEKGIEKPTKQQQLQVIDEIEADIERLANNEPIDSRNDIDKRAIQAS